MSTFVHQKKNMEINLFDDARFMQEALKEAHKALHADEVPVGAVVVCKNRIIARAHNLTEKLTDVTAHAEMQAITAAANYLGGKYLSECKIFITLEPCVMCAGALSWAQMGEIVYGASDPKRGFMKYGGQSLLHPKTIVKSGILEEECGQLLIDFFRKKRDK